MSRVSPLSDLAIRKMKERFRCGGALDFQDLIARFTLDSATEFLFGNCVHNMAADLPWAHNDPRAALNARAPSAIDAFATAFAGAQHVTSLRLRLGWMWRLQELTRDLAGEHMKVVDSYIQPILEQAIQKNRERKAGLRLAEDEENETLLDHLVKLTEGAWVAMICGMRC